MITPPIGLNCFPGNGVRSDISLSQVFRGVAVLVADVITIALLACPEVVTCLPDLMNNPTMKLPYEAICYIAPCYCFSHC